MGASKVKWEELRREAAERFGVRRFPPGQQEIIEAVLARKDVLGVLPTGAGKSLCFQLPALFMPGATVVVSPLIALMQDQAKHAAEAAIGAARLDSSLSAGEERDVEHEVSSGRPDIVYVTPERLAKAKLRQLEDIVNQRGTPGIVYVATVRLAEELHRVLRERGVDAARYHGKLRMSEREATQARFMSGEIPVMVATNAFGLGIDKPDVRFVAHWNFPESVESYYQEAGRAGRDGEPALAALLYRIEDKRIRSFFLGGKHPKREDMAAVQQALARAGPDGVTATELSRASGVPPRRVSQAVNVLEGMGIAVRAKGRRLRVAQPFASDGEVHEYLSTSERRHEADRDRLRAMIRYAESIRCRMQYMREYFGDDSGSLCKHCDACDSGTAADRDAFDRARSARREQAEASTT